MGGSRPEFQRYSLIPSGTNKVGRLIGKEGGTGFLADVLD